VALRLRNEKGDEISVFPEQQKEKIMSIKCDECSLAQIIQAKIDYFEDQAIGIYTLTTPDKRGLRLSLFVSDEDFEKSIFDFKLHQISKIAAEKDALSIYFYGLENKLTVFYKPCFSLDLDTSLLGRYNIKENTIANSNG
jgi:hypothetical protein